MPRTYCRPKSFARPTKRRGATSPFRSRSGPNVMPSSLDATASGQAAVGRALPPRLGPARDHAGHPDRGAPAPALVGGQRRPGVLEQRDRRPVLAMEHRRGFEHAAGHGEEAILAPVFLAPLQRHELVGQQRRARLDEPGVRGPRVERETRGVLLRAPGQCVVADEVDRPIGPVRVRLAHHAPDARRAGGIGGVAIVTDDEEPAVGRHVEAHALVHHRHPRLVTGDRPWPQVIDRKHGLGPLPLSAIDRRGDEGLPGREVLAEGVAQVLQVEAAVPVGEERRMAVRPAPAIGLLRAGAIGAQDLDVLGADHEREPPVVTVGIEGRADDAHRFGRAARLGRVEGDEQRQRRDEDEGGAHGAHCSRGGAHRSCRPHCAGPRHGIGWT